MNKLMSGLILSFIANANVYSGSMGEMSPIPFYTFVAVEGGYTWNDIKGISTINTGSASQGSLDSYGASSKTNSGGSARVSVGILRLLTNSVYFSGEVAWGYYGNTNLTLNETVIDTKNESTINGSTIGTTLTGFDVLVGAVYNQPSYDVFFKAGGLMQNSNLKGQLLTQDSSSSGGGVNNILAQATLPQILPEIKVGASYHITDSLGLNASYSHAFGYVNKVNIYSTSCEGGSGSNCAGGYYSQSLANVNLNPSLDIVLVGLQYRFA